MSYATPGPTMYVLGGLTGSGKTELLYHLAASGEQVLDLEALCCHDGSAFASLRYDQQPTSYQFHKQLNKAWMAFDKNRPLFIEQELPRIGKLNLPDWLYQQMIRAPVIWLQTNKHIRVQRILNLIIQADPIVFCESVNKLQDRLGSRNIQTILNHYTERNFEECVDLLLNYYDNSNGYTIAPENILLTLPVSSMQMVEYATTLSGFLSKTTIRNITAI